MSKKQGQGPLLILAPNNGTLCTVLCALWLSDSLSGCCVAGLRPVARGPAMVVWPWRRVARVWCMGLTAVAVTAVTTAVIWRMCCPPFSRRSQNG
jgi:hypothetical protein